MSIAKRSARIRAINGRSKHTKEERNALAEKLRKSIDDRSKAVRAA
jgi:hypothetical protein